MKKQKATYVNYCTKDINQYPIFYSIYICTAPEEDSKRRLMPLYQLSDVATMNIEYYHKHPATRVAEVCISSWYILPAHRTRPFPQLGN